MKFSDMPIQVINQSNIELVPNEVAKYEYSSENDHGTSKIIFDVKSNHFSWIEFSSSAQKISELAIKNSRISRQFSKIDSSVILKCPLNSDKILWFKSGKQITENNQIDSTRLFINKTRLSDSGSYDCYTIDFKEFHTIELIITGLQDLIF